ncbi:right-handed parallel beta-helix repeat-containing protein [bacterium]|nr:right-handed parallel beta-helix repeat-containing protein [bacterium]
MVRTLTWLGAAAICCLPVSARVFEVSPSGDNAGPGTVERPLKSIGRALQVAGPGDTVILHGGTYREGPVWIGRGGAEGRPLTIQPAPGAEVVWKGSDIVTGWQAVSNGIWRRPEWPVNSQQLLVDGQPLQQIGVQSPWHTHAVNDHKVSLPPVGRDLNDLVPGSFYYDATNRVLSCLLGDRSDPGQHVMEASVRDSLLNAESKSNVVLRGLTLLHSNGTAKGQWAGLLRVMGGAGWLVEDCTFACGDFAGATFSGERHVIRRCRFVGNGDKGLSLNGSGPEYQYKWRRDRPPQQILFEDLIVTNNNYRRFYEHWDAGGMKLIPAVRGVTVRRCYVADNWGPGIWFDGALGANVVEDNLVLRNRTGIFYEIAMPAAGDPFGILIRNNRVIANTNQGIYVAASSGAIVVSNTCYQNGWDIVAHGMPRRDFGFTMWLRDNVIRDNIVSGRKADVVVFVGGNTTNNIVDGNFYAAGGLASPGAFRPAVRFSAATNGYAVTHTALGRLFQELGFEEHGRAGDPQWVAPEAQDFHLRPGSPAAGKGWRGDLSWPRSQ